MCIGLNPSNARSDKDDPTIRQLINRLGFLGFGGLKMANLYSLVSSKPAKLFTVPDALRENDAWLYTIRESCNDVIYCWGSWKGIDHRVKVVTRLIPGGKCFGRSRNGSPLHPMALMYAGVKDNETTIKSYE